MIEVAASLSSAPLVVILVQVFEYCVSRWVGHILGDS